MNIPDDVVIIAKNFEKLRVMAEDQRRGSLSMSLTINMSKTKLMTNIKNFDTIYLDEREIEQVAEYKYLGQIFSLEDKTGKELKIKRANSWKAFWWKSIIFVCVGRGGGSFLGKLRLKLTEKLLINS